MHRRNGRRRRVGYDQARRDSDAWRASRRGDDAFPQAIERDPSNSEALLYLAGALASAGRPTDALPYFERAPLTLYPASTMALNGLGVDETRGG